MSSSSQRIASAVVVLMGLALAACALLPIFVLMTRKIGQVRREIASTKQGTLADVSSLVEESLSVSGVLLGKTMGKSDELSARFTSESRQLAELELRSVGLHAPPELVADARTPRPPA